jgi:hypothetical protein
MTTSGREPATLQLVVWRLNQLRYRVPRTIVGSKRENEEAYEKEESNHIILIFLCYIISVLMFRKLLLHKTGWFLMSKSLECLNSLRMTE